VAGCTMGDKTAENILHQIQRTAQEEPAAHPIGRAGSVDEVRRSSRTCPLKNLVAAGSLRAFRILSDIDLMGTPTTLPLLSMLLRHAYREAGPGSGPDQGRVIIAAASGDLRIVEHDAFGSLLQYFTGDKQHNVKLRERRGGWPEPLRVASPTWLRPSGKVRHQAAFYRRQGRTIFRK